ncbi:MAG: hypothetical protein S4CHLAM45_08890 [Chlamydiales bacterium]|nr:hypothetical protein [Chlamydiales bacterium]MCH9620559.1 hypothetical protein [Chlamydiales bacterium]MCH9622993.1 hypothetical protein [Chlamydiales bacterium]
MGKFLLVTLFLTTVAFGRPYMMVDSEPSIGGGFRQTKGHHGLDLSLSGSQTHSDRCYKAKSLYLFYPKPERQNRLYFGAGVSGKGKAKKFPVGSSQDGNMAFSGPTGEGVVGYEFRSPRGKTKLFTQLETSMPRSGKPEIRAKIGFGF